MLPSDDPDAWDRALPVLPPPAETPQTRRRAKMTRQAVPTEERRIVLIRPSPLTRSWPAISEPTAMTSAKTVAMHQETT